MTPITEMSLMDLLDAAAPGFGPEDDPQQWDADVQRVTKARWDLSNAVSVAQDVANRAERRADAKPEHWKEAHGELTRLRKALWESEGELLSLRFELERRVRRVRTGGGK